MRSLLATLLVISAGCDPEPVTIDRFPVVVDMTGGLPLVEVQAGEGTPVRVALDTGAAVTILDGPEASVASAELTILGTSPGGSVPRARWRSVPILYLPGTGDGSVAGVVGGDVLAQVAARWDLAAGEVRFFPGLPTDDDTYADLGGAVLDVRTAGGGTFLLGERDVTIPPSRLPIDVCLDQRASVRGLAPAGDGVLLFSTGIARTVLAESAYLRALRTLTPGVEPTWAYDDELWLPGARAPIAAHFTTLNRLALVGDEDDERGPCAELWTNQAMRGGGCQSAVLCACGDSLTCDAPAAVELARPLEIAVIASDDPYLQRLREELRPAYADVDGLLGADALRAMTVDADLPGGRMIFRCAPGEDGCQAFRRYDEGAPGRSLDP